MSPNPTVLRTVTERYTASRLLSGSLNADGEDASVDRYIVAKSRTTSGTLMQTISTPRAVGCDECCTDRICQARTPTTAEMATSSWTATAPVRRSSNGAVTYAVTRTPTNSATRPTVHTTSRRRS